LFACGKLNRVTDDSINAKEIDFSCCASNVSIDVFGCGCRFLVAQDWKTYKVFVLGEREAGSIGTGDNSSDEIHIPTSVPYRDPDTSLLKPFDFRIKKIGGGSKFTCLLDFAGRLFISGKLYCNTTYYTMAPYFNDNHIHIVDFACSWNNIIALDNLGNAYIIETDVQLIENMKFQLVGAAANHLLAEELVTGDIYSVVSNSCSLYMSHSYGWCTTFLGGGYFTNLVLQQQPSNSEDYMKSNLLKQVTDKTVFCNLDINFK
jgi:hypothetical protein